ncbi:LruC domain-containing protein [Pustulibacterium marinum]|uniref:LruC domain-containing protein n=1 Tax=Pustulibacterium marinum TaxID=1224947 RepID=A0A1I7GDY4_9FLAO|nr:LruC domain-containing protein [Pustulibacterium marinum]SFU46655.1 LruC domain-containing protein [Pustulibacterium marinum]
MKTFFKPLIGLLAITAMSCVNEKDLDPVDEATKNLVQDGPMQGMNVADDFNYETSKQIQLDLSVPDFLENATFKLYSKIENRDSVYLGKATFNNGNFTKNLMVSSAIDSVLIYSDYVGLTQDIRLGVNSDVLSFDYNDLYQEQVAGEPVEDTGSEAQRNANLTFSYLSTFDGNGLPTTMESSETIDQLLLDDINNSLPENAGGIPTTHPEFLSGKETEILITQTADVWLTFVAEGAGYRNSLGFYTYPAGNPPASIDDVELHYVAFPNASMQYSGGSLTPGNRVHLGQFPANTVISWFLVANGWSGYGVRTWSQRFYANPDFNPESTDEKRQHMVLLYDQARNLNILGFEDLNRDGSSDEDFNDAVFYVKSNPVTAISTNNVAVLDAANDSDGDGINDALDEFPYDINKAFNTYYPSAQNSGTLAYEDLWPSQGDYDFNDLVVDYNFNLVSNGDNLVTQINASYTIEHIGGAFHNGFAFVLPIDPSSISDVSGQVLNGGYEVTNANGTESGTLSNETVIIVCGNAINETGETITVTVNFSTPQELDALGEVPFNTFLISNGDRSREVHLPDHLPTSKAGYLSTEDDYSDEVHDRYYKTDKNLPWGLNIYYDFTPPTEKTPITTAYPKFKTWANSGGEQELEWYKD